MHNAERHLKTSRVQIHHLRVENFKSEHHRMVSRTQSYHRHQNAPKPIHLLYILDNLATEWNKQHLSLCLKVHSKNSQNNTYYVTGSIGELGGWKEKKMMQTIEVGFKNKMITLIKGDP